jgi:hypothetical protein
MTYYLIYREKELRLIAIEPPHEALFCEANAHRILASGSSILEALRAFNNLPLIFCDGL